MTFYLVFGGVHEDTTFETIRDEDFEDHGIFDSYEQARQAWWQATCKNVDICEHRIFIQEVIV